MVSSNQSQKKICVITDSKGPSFFIKGLYLFVNKFGFDLKIISTNRNSTGIKFAKKEGIDYTVISSLEYSTDLANEVVEADSDIVLLLFRKILKKPYFQLCNIPTINVHPSLLPSFKGFNSIDKAIVHGVKITGVTIHYADEELDNGSIISQSIIPLTEDIKSYEDVKETVLVDSLIMSLQAILWILEDNIRVEKRVVRVIDATYKSNKYFPDITEDLLCWFRNTIVYGRECP